MINTKMATSGVHIAHPAHHVFTILDQKFSTFFSLHTSSVIPNPLAVIDMPIQAFILALIGALVLAKLVVSWVTFLAETFAFGGSSVRLPPSLPSPN
jgi:hypothetical protein